MAKINKEQEIAKAISPLAELLGAERTEVLKDRIVDLIVNQIQEDLDAEGMYVISTDEIGEIAAEALEDIAPKLRKKFGKMYSDMADAYIAKLEQSIKEI